MKESQTSENISTKLTRIAEAARKYSVLRTLSHHIDDELLMEAFRRVRKDGAVGVDGQTASEYEKNLKGNLGSLLDRFKGGSYQAPPVKRTYIPKADGTKRPLGLPTFEDKLLQQAVKMVLEAVYEQSFHDCSYGYRPKRSAHDALATLRNELMAMNGGWVYEVDIKSFFDTLDHKVLRDFLDRRVVDGPIRRTINKWLAAGVLEEGQLRRSEEGTPQGGVISPLLANVYLHEVLDRWFEEDVKPRMRGRVFLVRYADDFVLGFELEADARRVEAVLPKRFEKFGLTVHPTKTRLLDFRRPAKYPLTGPARDARPETFDFLAFCHYWARSRKDNWVIKQKTARSRLRRAILGVREWLFKHRHRSVEEQWKHLTARLNGYFNYFGLTDNGRALRGYVYEVRRAWKAALTRRSQRGMAWAQFERISRRYPLPEPVCVRSVLRSAKPYPKSRMR